MHFFLFISCLFGSQGLMRCGVVVQFICEPYFPLNSFMLMYINVQSIVICEGIVWFKNFIKTRFMLVKNVDSFNSY